MGTIEYAPALPRPVSVLGQKAEKYTSLFVTEAGEFLQLPTEEQAIEKASILMKKFKPEEWWAQLVSKFKVGNNDYLCAFIVRDFSKLHDRTDLSTKSQDQFWLGREEIGIPKHGFDSDAQSDTFGERVPMIMKAQMQDGSVKDIPVLEKKGFHSYHRATKENIAMYKKMSGETPDGKVTEFVFVMQGGGRNVSEDDPERFWNTGVSEMQKYDRDIKRSAREPAAPANASSSLK